MPLNTDARPTEFKDFLGNTETVKSLQSILERKDKTHAMLFTGPSGCGKTTLARIVANKLECSEHDFTEINAANDRGIETLRKIVDGMKFKPMAGKVKVYLLDECFAKGTIIYTPTGHLPIEKIKKGDIVNNIEGDAVVKDVFKNKVNLDRVIKLNFYNYGIKNYLICSKEHLFLTDKGWKKAVDLTKKDLILKFDYGLMSNKIKQKDFKNDRKNMSGMQPEVPNEKQKKNVLFCFLFKQKQKETTDLFRKKLRILWKTYACKKDEEHNKKILQFQLCSQTQKSITSYTRSKQISRKYKKKNIGIKKVNEGKSRKTQKTGKRTFYSNERKQSNEQSKDNRKNDEHKKNKWDLTCLDGDSWRQWPINRTTNFIGFCFRMGNRISSPIGKKTKRISNKLQSGHWKLVFKNRNRGRWERPQIEKEYIKRFKKRKQIEGIRLDNIEIYQSGSNDKSFSGIIGNKERNQGYVTFYDLEIDGHPSYFANDVLVHNCHKLNKFFQDGLLKPLEDCPKHVYFILCTTNPENIIKTVKNRCTEFTVNSLSSKQIKRLLFQVCKKEKINISGEILTEVSENVDGCPRQALIVLDKIRDMPEEDINEILRQTEINEKQIIDLCRALIKKADWKTISDVVKGIKEDPEKVRYAVLGYMSSVLLGGDNTRAAIIIEEFSEPFYNSGKPGLVLACYRCLN